VTTPAPRHSNPRFRAAERARFLALSTRCRAVGYCACGDCKVRAFEAGMQAIRAFDVREQMRESVRSMDAVIAARVSR